MENLKSRESGYATIAAIVLCATLSLVCAGALAMVQAQKKQSERLLFRRQQAEAMNTALLHLGADVARSNGDETLQRQETIAVPGGRMTIDLRAENEARKWPLRRVQDVDDAVLGLYVTATKAGVVSQLQQSTSVMPKEDCLRSLFSYYGAAAPDKPLFTGRASTVVAGGHDGQVWRLTAINGNQVQDRQVRFLGDPDHLFAVVSQDNLTLGEMPTCKQSMNKP